jgi:hypothetical protein
MSSPSVPASRTTVPVGCQPSDKWLLGIVLAVINFWLFAQTLLNVVPGISGDLGMTPTVANLAVSVTSLMSGCFIVLSLLALFLVKDTPVSKAPATGHTGFDWSGLITFVIAMLAINVHISQGPRIGWLSPTGPPCWRCSW